MWWQGTLDFTARVGGRVNTKTNLAVLRGFVSEGPAWLIGAGVHDEFQNYTRADGTPGEEARERAFSFSCVVVTHAVDVNLTNASHAGGRGSDPEFVAHLRS